MRHKEYTGICNAGSLLFNHMDMSTMTFSMLIAANTRTFNSYLYAKGEIIVTFIEKYNSWLLSWRKFRYILPIVTRQCCRSDPFKISAAIAAKN